jgi:PhoH-like ATPase
MSLKSETLILDTSVCLHHPDCLNHLSAQNIVIPSVVFEELDKFKTSMDLRGYSAREFLRNFDKLKGDQKLKDGIPLKNGAKVYVKYFYNKKIELPPEFDASKMDNIILKIVLQSQEEFVNCVLLSKDTNLRIKAEILNIKAKDYTFEKQQSLNNILSENMFYVNDSIIESIYQKNSIDVEELKSVIPEHVRYAILKGEVNNKKSVLVKKDNLVYKKFDVPNVKLMGNIKASNVQQQFLIDALYDPKIKIVFVVGVAGTGKTLLALDCGLEQVLTDTPYKRLIVSRSPIPVGRDIGYLPGNLEEKMNPWLAPIWDNLEYILENSDTFDTKITTEITIEELIRMKKLEVSSLTYMRGRSLQNAFILIDEAQNLTNHEIKTILTRVGKNSKIVFTGDIYQIDNPFLSIDDNGLSIASNKFTEKKNDIATTILLTKSERSDVAAIAAEIL